MKRKLTGLAVVTVLLTVAGVGLWYATADAEGISIPYEDAGAVTAGASLYAQHCAACHGAELAGDENWQETDEDGLLRAPPHDETGHTWHHPDRLLFEITKFGTEAVVGGGYKSNMQGFGDILTDAQILSVLAYIKSTWPERVIQVHDRINAEAGG